MTTRSGNEYGLYSALPVATNRAGYTIDPANSMLRDGSRHHAIVLSLQQQTANAKYAVHSYACTTNMPMINSTNTVPSKVVAKPAKAVTTNVVAAQPVAKLNTMASSKEYSFVAVSETLPTTTNYGSTPTNNASSVAPNRTADMHQEQQMRSATVNTNAANEAKIATKKPKKLSRRHHIYCCDVCVISCCGLRSFQEHLEGQKHKTKDARKAAKCAKRGKILCKLCDVTTKSLYEYTTHIEGAKHHKNLVKLISSMESIILNNNNNSDITINATTNKSLKALPASVNGIRLSTMATNTVVPTRIPEMKESSLKIVSKQQGTVKDLSKMEDKLECQLAEKDYFEEIKNDKGRVICMQCNLCNFWFNGPKMKEQHVSGLQHKLQFTEKVNPNLTVGLNLSSNCVKPQEELTQRQEEKRMVEEERLSLEERSLAGDETRYDHDVSPLRPIPTEMLAGPLTSVTEEIHEIKNCKEEAAIVIITTNEPKMSETVTLTPLVTREINYLQGGGGCEKYHVDAGSPLSNQELSDIIANAQLELELFAISQINDILGINQLPLPLRFSRKRKWDNSSEEGTKGSDEKMGKKEKRKKTEGRRKKLRKKIN